MTNNIPKCLLFEKNRKYDFPIRQIRKTKFEGIILIKSDREFEKKTVGKLINSKPRQKSNIFMKSVPTARLFYFYNLQMETIDTLQDTSGCRGGP